jgi:hypothetical protein
VFSTRSRVRGAGAVRASRGSACGPVWCVPGVGEASDRLGELRFDVAGHDHLRRLPSRVLHTYKAYR